MKVFIEAIRSNFKELKVKWNSFISDKNIDNKIYLNIMNLTIKIVFNNNSKFVNVFNVDVAMK